MKSAKLSFTDRALAALGQSLCVQSVALTSVAPLTGENWVDNLERPDHPVPPGQEPPINVRFVNPDYLPTMQIPLLAGRNIAASDRANPYVALISERTARESFSGEDPVGKKINGLIPDDNHPMTVIGVVADTRINGIKDTAAMVYLPYWSFTPWTLSFLVRSSQPSDALIPEMRRTIMQIDPHVAIPTLRSMDEQVSYLLSPPTAFSGDGAWRFRRVRIIAGAVWRVRRPCILGPLRRQEFSIRHRAWFPAVKRR